MISLLMSCKTLQSSKQKTTAVATDTTTITQVAAQDSASIIARVDSIIIIEYNADEQESITPSVGQSKPGLKCSSKKKMTLHKRVPDQSRRKQRFMAQTFPVPGYRKTIH